jgi:hypothetical protein
MCWPPTFGKPASLFEKFPRKDVFLTDKEGAAEPAATAKGK